MDGAVENIGKIAATKDPKKIGEAMKDRKDGIDKMIPLADGPIKKILEYAKKELKDVKGPVSRPEADKLDKKLNTELIKHL